MWIIYQLSALSQSHSLHRWNICIHFEEYLCFDPNGLNIAWHKNTSTRKFLLRSREPNVSKIIQWYLNNVILMIPRLCYYPVQWAGCVQYRMLKFSHDEQTSAKDDNWPTRTKLCVLTIFNYGTMIIPRHQQT